MPKKCPCIIAINRQIRFILYILQNLLSRLNLTNYQFTFRFAATYLWKDFCSFLGGNENKMICFWDFLTFTATAQYSAQTRRVGAQSFNSACNAMQSKQSHYIQVAQGKKFREHKIKFGLVLGRLAILKKSNFWG